MTKDKADRQNIYLAQQRKRIRRRRRRIKCFLCRGIVCLVLFILVAVSVKMVKGLVRSNDEYAGRNVDQMQAEASAKTPPPENTLEPEAVNVSASDLISRGYDPEIVEELFAMAEQEPGVGMLLNQVMDYPEELLELLAKNEETLDFVLQYPQLKASSTISEDIDLTDCYSPGEIPRFLQWDTRWGYCMYGNKLIATAGCGPTCLSMVMVGLTGDTRWNPGVLAQFSYEQGYCDKDNGTVWALMTEGAGQLGLNSKVLNLDENVIARELEAGHPVICSMRPGDFTTTGHFIVLCGYRNGQFIVHDPNSVVRSEETWSYETLQYQIKNIWAFSLP